MAVATTVARNGFNRGLYGSMNLRVVSTTGISAGTVLTIAGDLVMTVKKAMSGKTFRCVITTMPRGKNRLIVRTGDTVTG